MSLLKCLSAMSVAMNAAENPKGGSTMERIAFHPHSSTCMQ